MIRALLLLSLVALLATPALANIADGSWVEIRAPYTASPGEEAIYEFYVYNGSPDGESASMVSFRFPEPMIIEDGWFDDLGQGWDFVFETAGEFVPHYAFFISNSWKFAISTRMRGWPRDARRSKKKWGAKQAVAWISRLGPRQAHCP